MWWVAPRALGGGGAAGRRRGRRVCPAAALAAEPMPARVCAPLAVVEWGGGAMDQVQCVAGHMWWVAPRALGGGGAAPRRRGQTRVPRRGPRCRAHASPGVCTSGSGGVGWGCNGSSAMRGGAHVVGGTPGPRRRRGGAAAPAADACAPPRLSLPSPCQPGPVHLWRWWSGVGVQWIKCNAWRGTCGGWHPGPSAAAGRRRGAAADACAPPRLSLPSPCQPGPVHLWRWWSGVGVQWIKCNAWRGTCGGWHPGPSAAAGRRGRRVCPAAALAAEPMPARACAPLAVMEWGEGAMDQVQCVAGHMWWVAPRASAAAGRRRGAAADACARRGPRCRAHARPGVCTSFFFLGGGGGGGLTCLPVWGPGDAGRILRGLLKIGHPGRARGRCRGGRHCVLGGVGTWGAGISASVSQGGKGREVKGVKAGGCGVLVQDEWQGRGRGVLQGARGGAGVLWQGEARGRRGWETRAGGGMGCGGAKRKMYGAHGGTSSKVGEGYSAQLLSSKPAIGRGRWLCAGELLPRAAATHALRGCATRPARDGGVGAGEAA